MQRRLKSFPCILIDDVFALGFARREPNGRFGSNDVLGNQIPASCLRKKDRYDINALLVFVKSFGTFLAAFSASNALRATQFHRVSTVLFLLRLLDLDTHEPV